MDLPFYVIRYFRVLSSSLLFPVFQHKKTCPAVSAWMCDGSFAIVRNGKGTFHISVSAIFVTELMLAVLKQVKSTFHFQIHRPRAYSSNL